MTLNKKEAEVAEQADALRSGRSGLYAHVGSTPTFGIDKTGFRSLNWNLFLLPPMSCDHSPEHKEMHNL